MRQPLPKVDGHVGPVLPALVDQRVLRQHYDDLTTAAKDKRCLVCRSPIAVAYRNQDHFLRCGCYPDAPQLYIPETGLEFYERTGTGDAVSIMQVERQRAKRIKRARERMGHMNKTEMVLFKTPEGEEVGLDIETIKEMFCEKATDAEATLFLRVCQFQGMNPFLRDAYLVKYDETKPASIVIGKGFYEQRAAEDPNYKGMRAGIVVERGGQQVELDGMLMQKADTLVGGWAEVHRRDRTFPTKIAVALSEYSKRQATWTQIPATMIRKVALVQALREAFPNRFHPIPGMDAGQVIDEEELPFMPGPDNKVILPNESSIMTVEGAVIDRSTGEITGHASEETVGRDPDDPDASMEVSQDDGVDGTPYEDWQATCPIHSEHWVDSERFGLSHFLSAEEATREDKRACYFGTVTVREARRLIGTEELKAWLSQHRGGRLWSKLSEAEQLATLVELKATVESVGAGSVS